MPFVAVPNTARVVVQFSLFDEVFQNIYHATKTDFTQTDMQNLADAVDGVHTALRMASFANDVLYRQTIVYDIRSAGGSIVNSITNTRPGSGGSEALGVGYALVVTHYTATRGRSGRGRTYVSGMPRGDYVDQAFTQSQADEILAYVGEIFTAIESVGWESVIVSRQQNEVVLNPPVTRPIISSTIRSLRPGIQRRRVDRP